MAPPLAPPPVAPKKRRSTMTLQKKAAILKLLDNGRKQADVAKEFQLPKQTLSDYVKNKEKILSALEHSHNKHQKNDRKGEHPVLEEALQLWLKGVLSKNLPVSGDALKQKAETLALKMDIENFKFTDGWLRGFKKRHGILFKKVCGESGAVDQTTVADYRLNKLKALLQKFAPEDVFNCDETGLFFKMLPDRSLCFDGDSCKGGKNSKDRITVMVGANAVGTEKLPLLIIGKAKNPRCFKGMKKLSVGDKEVQLVVVGSTSDSRSFKHTGQVAVWYSSNTKAWITHLLFEDYLRRLDRVFEHQKRRVVIFVDNCGAHGAVDNLKAIRLEFLPPNTTSVLQPMDQGIIQNVKVHYRARLLRRTVLCLDNGKRYAVDLHAAVKMLTDAWIAVRPSTIANCFNHAGFCASVESLADNASLDHQEAEDIAAAADVDESLFADLRDSGMDIPDAATFSAFADLDSNLELCAELTDEEIVRQVLGQPEEDSDSDDNDHHAQPSTADITSALTLLSNVYSENMTLAQMQADVISRRRKMKQGTLDDSFKSA
ncbi:tigger transposable element-derived protein 4-like [Ixodes scapularis]